MRLLLLLGCAVLLAGCHSEKESASNETSSIVTSGAAGPAPQGYSVPASGLLSINDLVNIAKMRRDHVDGDQFSKPYDDPHAEGRKFRAVLNVTDEGTLMGTSDRVWSYDVQTEKLTIEVAGPVLNGGFFASEISIPLSYGIQDSGTTKEHNAFGAEVEVQHTDTWRIELGGSGAPAIGVFREKDNEFGHHVYQGLKRVLPLAPDAARAASTGLKLVLEGTLVRRNSKLASCFDENHTGSFANPHAFNNHICLINARFDHVVLVQPSGKVLAEWTGSPPGNGKRGPTLEETSSAARAAMLEDKQGSAGASKLGDDEAVDENGTIVHATDL